MSTVNSFSLCPSGPDPLTGTRAASQKGLTIFSTSACVRRLYLAVSWVESLPLGGVAAEKLEGKTNYKKIAFFLLPLPCSDCKAGQRGKGRKFCKPDRQGQAKGYVHDKKI